MKLKAVAALNANPSTRRPSDLYKQTLISTPVKTFEAVSAPQCPRGLYPVLFSAPISNGIIRFVCGYGTPNGPCTATCNPNQDGSLAFPCKSRKTAHDHHDYDVGVAFFIVVPSHHGRDCGTRNPNGKPIAIRFALGSQVPYFQYFIILGLGFAFSVLSSSAHFSISFQFKTTLSLSSSLLCLPAPAVTIYNSFRYFLHNHTPVPRSSCPLLQAIEEKVYCSPEEYLDMDADGQSSTALYLDNTVYAAVLEKKPFGMFWACLLC